MKALLRGEQVWRGVQLVDDEERPLHVGVVQARVEDSHLNVDRQLNGVPLPRGVHRTGGAPLHLLHNIKTSEGRKVSFNDALNTLYLWKKEGRKRFYVTMHSTHFIHGYMASDIW